MPRPKPPTSVDVARLAGVSQSSVSRVYSLGSNISEETRHRVLTAARQLNYVPNSIARSLITQQSNIIAIVLGDIRNPFYVRALEEFNRRLQDLGKHVLVFNVPRSSEIDDALSRVLQYQIDGIIITAASMSTQMASTCIALDIPVVMFNRYVPGLLANSVCCDNTEGGRLAAEALLSAGGKRFGIIYGEHNTTTNKDRIQGFKARLKKAGISISAIPQICGDYTYDGGYRAALRILQSDDRPDALFCLNDIMALGTIAAARAELKLRIPKDLMIVGFDDIPEAARQEYNLTTIEQPVSRMVDDALSLLLPAEAGEASQQVKHVIPGRLIIRGTTRPPTTPAGTAKATGTAKVDLLGARPRKR